MPVCCKLLLILFTYNCLCWGITFGTVWNFSLFHIHLKYYHTPQQRKIPNCKGKIEPQHMHVYHVMQKTLCEEDSSKHPFYAILACMPHQALCVHWSLHLGQKDWKKYRLYCFWLKGQFCYHMTCEYFSWSVIGIVLCSVLFPDGLQHIIIEVVAGSHHSAALTGKLNNYYSCEVHYICNTSLPWKFW